MFSSITVDFERAPIKALQSEIDLGRVSLCAVHFKRSVDRKVNTLRLMDCPNDKVRAFMKRMASVCYLPMQNEYVRKAVRTNVDDMLVYAKRKFAVENYTKCEKFAVYMNTTYLNDNASFNYTLWSHARTDTSPVLAALTATTNLAESLNNSLKCHLPSRSVDLGNALNALYMFKKSRNEAYKNFLLSDKLEISTRLTLVRTCMRYNYQKRLIMKTSPNCRKRTSAIQVKFVCILFDLM